MKIFVKQILAASLMTALLATGAKAQSVENIYHNKTLRILVPTGAGGDRSLYTNVFASFFGRHIPGNPSVVPVFMPGAGGSVALNNAYGVAAPDGLTIVTPLTSVLAAQIVGDQSVKYDATKFKWIGRTADATRVLFVSTKLNVSGLDDLRRQQVIVGSDGFASETYRNAAFMNNVFGTKFKIVADYESAGAMNMAVDSGETEGSFTTWDDISSYHSDWLRDKKVKVILQIALSKNPDLESVPLLLDLASNETERELVQLMSSSAEMGQSFAAPPGVSEPIVAALRKAFDDTMKDPDFIAKMHAAKMHFDPISGSEITDAVMKIMNTPSVVIERYKAAVAGTH
jgi:tripartite-type tricarboxylate transporter receptor subunit TctC